jgi:membrane protein involved in colicin uptake
MKRFSEGSKELTETEKAELEKREENRKKALEKQEENEKKAKEKADALALKKLEDKKKFDEETQKQIEELNRFKSEKELEESVNKRNLLDEQIALLNEEVDAVQSAETKKATITLEQERAIADGKKAIQEATFNNISNGIGLLKGLFEKNKGLQKALLIAESAAGIAKIIISTKAANAAAKLKYALLPGGVALAAAESTMNNVGAGIGIAANIAATAKGLSALGGGGSSGGANVGGDGNGGGAAPQFNVVGQGGANQIAQSIAGQEQQPIKAFVVANDVTTGQSLNRNIINNASMG